MSKAKNGDLVKVHYTGKFTDGKIFDTSEGKTPLEFKIGSGQVIKGFEEAVTGMALNEKKTANVTPENAYGEYLNELAFVLEENAFPEDQPPKLGQSIEMEDDNGNILNVTVIDINEGKVILDANHPLAGQTLVFEIELVEIA